MSNDDKVIYECLIWKFNETNDFGEYITKDTVFDQSLLQDNVEIVHKEDGIYARIQINNNDIKSPKS